MNTKFAPGVLENHFAFALIACVIVMHVLKQCAMTWRQKNRWKKYYKTMARIRTTTYTMEKNFCGRCGIILSKRLDIFDRCPKCKEVIEAWNIIFQQLFHDRLWVGVIHYSFKTSITILYSSKYYTVATPGASAANFVFISHYISVIFFF